MNYFERVQTTIDYIEENLSEDITLEILANKAFFSMFHYHRIFQAMVGETIMEYIRKRRLANAVHNLLNTNKRIIDIAFEYQFNSQENFTRAFKKVYGVTPGECRKNKKQLSVFGKANLLKVISNKGGVFMEPKIITRKSFKVIGIELITTNENGENLVQIPKFWDKYLDEKVYERIPNRVKLNETFAICRDIDGTGKISYTICAKVNSSDNIPDGMIGKTVPESKYAVFTVKGKVPEKVQETWNYIYGTWLPDSGYEPANIEGFELYDERYKENCNDSVIDIYIPIK